MAKALTVVLGKPARDPIGVPESGRGACSCTSACPYCILHSQSNTIEILVHYLEVRAMVTLNL